MFSSFSLSAPSICSFPQGERRLSLLSSHKFLSVLLITTVFMVLATVAACAAEITVGDLTPIVTAHVRAKVLAFQGKTKPDDDETLTVQVLSIPGAPYRFENSKSIQLSCESAAWNNNWTDHAIVRVKMSDATGRSREIGVPVRVSIQKSVWVVRHLVNANTPLQLRDMSLELRDVSANYAYIVGSDKDLGTYNARVNLLPGEWLDNRKMSIPPDIRYNDQIHIVMLGSNGMELNVPGVALSDGQIGQTIRVRQVAFQRRDYQGKIIDKNAVQVEL
jgi:flagella basal body P-ring formation protein FlgA